MTLKASTGLRNKMLDTGSLKATMANPVILIYSGAVPATADAAATGTLLVTISDNATGSPLAFDTAAGGILPKSATQVWKGVNVATGTASYFRMVTGTDTGASSTTEARLQGTVGTAGADLNLSSVNLTTGADQTIDAANVALPTF